MDYESKMELGEILVQVLYVNIKFKFNGPVNSSIVPSLGRGLLCKIRLKHRISFCINPMHIRLLCQIKFRTNHNKKVSWLFLSSFKYLVVVPIVSGDEFPKNNLDTLILFIQFCIEGKENKGLLHISIISMVIFVLSQ